MTGRDVIIYILQNGLENEEVIATMSEDEAAILYGVGHSTIRAWWELGSLVGFYYNDELYILKSNTDPRIKK